MPGRVRYTSLGIRGVRSESLKKPDGRSELRRAGFISRNKRGKWSQPRETVTHPVVLRSVFLSEGYQSLIA